MKRLARRRVGLGGSSVGNSFPARGGSSAPCCWCWCLEHQASFMLVVPPFRLPPRSAKSPPLPRPPLPSPANPATRRARCGSCDVSGTVSGRRGAGSACPQCCRQRRPHRRGRRERRRQRQRRTDSPETGSCPRPRPCPLADRPMPVGTGGFLLKSSSAAHFSRSGPRRSRRRLSRPVRGVYRTLEALLRLVVAVAVAMLFVRARIL